jgi:ABC-2 type transport system permease protein
MNQLLTFIRKEFLHVLRDRKTLLILFGLPIVQILLFGFALTNEVRNANIAIVDDAHDVASRSIIGMIAASRSFQAHELPGGHSSIDETFRNSGVKLIVLFPANFNSDLMHTQRARVQIIADASDPNTASTLTTYVSAIIADYQKARVQTTSLPYTISTNVRMLYNPQLKGAPNFVPGVMALVLMLVCVMMTSIAIVREKELGTMEILLVSPFKPILVIVAKVVPYLLLSLVNVASILVLSVYVLDLPVQGSVVLLVAVSTVFIITSLALGLLISTITNSQQTAMLFSMMGMLLPTTLFSGFMFPIENMPLPLQIISNAVPARWYYIIVKSVMIKGLGFTAIWRELLVLVGMTAVLIIISLRKFKVRLA